MCVGNWEPVKRITVVVNNLSHHISNNENEFVSAEIRDLLEAVVKIGFLSASTMLFGRSSVTGRILVPSPAASTTTCMVV